MQSYSFGFLTSLLLTSLQTSLSSWTGAGRVYDENGNIVTYEGPYNSAYNKQMHDSPLHVISSPFSAENMGLTVQSSSGPLIQIYSCSSDECYLSRGYSDVNPGANSVLVGFAMSDENCQFSFTPSAPLSALGERAGLSYGGSGQNPHYIFPTNMDCTAEQLAQTAIEQNAKNVNIDIEQLSDIEQDDMIYFLKYLRALLPDDITLSIAPECPGVYPPSGPYVKGSVYNYWVKILEACPFVQVFTQIYNNWCSEFPADSYENAMAVTGYWKEPAPSMGYSGINGYRLVMGYCADDNDPISCGSGFVTSGTVAQVIQSTNEKYACTVGYGLFDSRGDALAGYDLSNTFINGLMPCYDAVSASPTGFSTSTPSPATTLSPTLIPSFDPTTNTTTAPSFQPTQQSAAGEGHSTYLITVVSASVGSALLLVLCYYACPVMNRIIFGNQVLGGNKMERDTDQREQLLNPEATSEEPVTCWMRLEAAIRITTFPCYFFYAIPAASIETLWLCYSVWEGSAYEFCLPWPQKLNKTYFTQCVLGVVVAGLIVIGIMQTNCLRDYELTNNSSYDFDFTSLDPKDSDFSPQQLNRGKTAEFSVPSDSLTVTAQFQQDPGYLSVTFDNKGKHAHYSGGLAKLKSSFPEYDWGVCRYYLEDASSTAPTSCTTISVINLTDLTCEQTGDLQPATATASTTTVAANGGSVNYGFASDESWITVDYYNGNTACGTWTFENNGKTAKAENTANQLAFVEINSEAQCVYHYSSPSTRSLRGQWYDFFAVEQGTKATPVAKNFLG